MKNLSFCLVWVFLVHALGWSMEDETKMSFLPVLMWHSNAGSLNEEHHTDGINELRFSPDGTRLLTGSQRQKFLRLADTGKVIKKIEGNKPQFSHDGRLLATIDNQVVQLYFAVNGERATPRGLYGHDKDVWSISFFNKDNRIVTSSRDGEAKIWNAETGACLLTLNHPDIVKFVSVTSDDKRVITACKDGIIRVWNLERGELIRSINVGGDYQIIAYGLASKVALYFYTHLQNKIVLWDIESGERELTIDLGQRTCGGLIFAKEKNYLVGNCEDGIKVWSLRVQRENRDISTHFGLKSAVGCRDTILAASLRTLAQPGFGQSRYELQLFNLEAGMPVVTLLAENKSGMISLEFSDDGTYLAAGSDNYNCSVICWLLPPDELLNPPDELAKKTYIHLIKEYLHHCSNTKAVSHADFVEFIATKYPEKTLGAAAEFERVMFMGLNSNSRRYLTSLLPGLDYVSKY